MHVLALLLAAPVALQGPTEQLGWMAGHWRTADGSVEEVWLAPRDGSMLGMNRSTGAPGFEFLRIVTEDGASSYLASPGGAPAVRFRMLLPAARGEVQFENPAHDFPKTITYRRQGEDRLQACVGDGARETCWDFQRVVQP